MSAIMRGGGGGEFGQNCQYGGGVFVKNSEKIPSCLWHGWFLMWELGSCDNH